MRALLLCSLILFTLKLTAAAQQQEQKLMDRVLKPKTELNAHYQNRSYYGGKTFEAGAARTKTFSILNIFRSKEYRSKGYEAKAWQGDFQFNSKTANTTPRNIIKNATKEYDTKNAATKEAHDAGKAYGTAAYGTAEFQARGKSQKSIDQEYTNREPMNIDQVRELLNKNK